MYKYGVKAFLLIGFCLSALMLTNVLIAAPQVTLEVIAEKDIVEVDKKGKKTTKRVIAAETVPGDILFYTLRYENRGDETARNVQLDNPVPKGTIFQPNSAWGEKSDILFSIDEAKTFKKATNLTYEVKKPDGKVEKRQVEPEQYQAIRWVIAEIPVNAKGTAGFSIIVQ